MAEKITSVADVIKRTAKRPETGETPATPDYEKMYVEECAKNKALSEKVTNLEGLCKSYAEREKQTVETLQRATLEYNARTQYMVDCVKHAYLSMQFSINASDKQPGGAQ